MEYQGLAVANTNPDAFTDWFISERGTELDEDFCDHEQMDDVDEY